MMKTEECLPARCGGICYPHRRVADADAFFAEFLNWGQTDNETLPADFCGIITPHLDFRVTKHAYASAWRPYLTAEWPELFIILGVGHKARREWCTDGRDWRTVYGRAMVHDLDLLPEPTAFLGEHSIEFALVCLQALKRHRGLEQPLKFVPVLCGGLHAVIEAGRDLEADGELYLLVQRLRQLHQEFGRKLGWIVSIDGCHIGPRFGHPFPVTPKILRETREWENQLWSEIAKPELDGFIEFLRHDGNQRYFDGVGALTLLRSVLGPDLKIQRTDEEQWSEKDDASVVTVSSGILTLD
jgi:predicted class III extradiol MEMO1 family dioxygenase